MCISSACVSHGNQTHDLGSLCGAYSFGPAPMQMTLIKDFKQLSLNHVVTSLDEHFYALVSALGVKYWKSHIQNFVQSELKHSIIY